MQAPAVPFEQNQKLCLDLMKKGPHAFEKFVRCLFKSNLEAVGERLVVYEYNFRHRANIRNYQQLPLDIREKYTVSSGNHYRPHPKDERRLYFHFLCQSTLPCQTAVRVRVTRRGYASCVHAGGLFCFPNASLDRICIKSSYITSCYV